MVTARPAPTDPTDEVFARWRDAIDAALLEVGQPRAEFFRCPVCEVNRSLHVHHLDCWPAYPVGVVRSEAWFEAVEKAIRVCAPLAPKKHRVCWADELAAL